MAAAASVADAHPLIASLACVRQAHGAAQGPCLLVQAHVVPRVSCGVALRGLVLEAPGGWAAEALSEGGEPAEGARVAPGESLSAAFLARRGDGDAAGAARPAALALRFDYEMLVLEEEGLLRDLGLGAEALEALAGLRRGWTVAHRQAARLSPAGGGEEAFRCAARVASRAGGGDAFGAVGVVFELRALGGAGAGAGGALLYRVDGLGCWLVHGKRGGELGAGAGEWEVRCVCVPCRRGRLPLPRLRVWRAAAGGAEPCAVFAEPRAADEWVGAPGGAAFLLSLPAGA